MILDNFKIKSIFLKIKPENCQLKHLTIEEENNYHNTQYVLGGIIEGSDGFYHKFLHKQDNLSDFRDFEDVADYVYQLSSQVEFSSKDIDYLHKIHHNSYTTDSDCDYMFYCLH